ncbi:MAG: transcriptional repressor [Candidatus Omnitrophica bacterium]|nr:transcriptional repressor [Candidatus Omnitrophota bacterium]
MKSELAVLDEFIRSKGLRHTHQREEILNIFLSTEKHVSIDELFKLVKRHDKRIGYTTVYRTMKLLSESGLCGEIDFGDGILRFEHKYGHEHHDHLICTKCGAFIEVMKPKIEELQERLSREHGFTPMRHRLQIFGLCKRCS